MVIAVDIVEQVLQQRGYKKVMEGSPSRAIDKKGCYQLPSGTKVYVNYVGKKAPRSSLVVSPDIPECQKEGWLWTPEWAHSHQLKSFPKRKNKGQQEIHYGRGIRFESAQAVHAFCDYLESREGSETALGQLGIAAHVRAPVDADSGSGLDDQGASTGIDVSTGTATLAPERLSIAAEPLTQQTADDVSPASLGAGLAMPQPTVPGRDVLVQTTRRVGHDGFRRALEDYWGGACAITGVRTTALLRASHIKPWAMCEPEEQTSVFNGLLLAAHWDAAFDRGLITLDVYGAVLLSPQLSEEDAAVLGFVAGMRLRKPMQPQHLPYFAYHRQHVFLAA